VRDGVVVTEVFNMETSKSLAELIVELMEERAQIDAAIASLDKLEIERAPHRGATQAQTATGGRTRRRSKLAVRRKPVALAGD
jgi:hypothetical protein